MCRRLLKWTLGWLTREMWRIFAPQTLYRIRTGIQGGEGREGTERNTVQPKPCKWAVRGSKVGGTNPMVRRLGSGATTLTGGHLNWCTSGHWCNMHVESRGCELYCLITFGSRACLSEYQPSWKSFSAPRSVHHQHHHHHHHYHYSYFHIVFILFLITQIIINLKLCLCFCHTSWVFLVSLDISQNRFWCIFHILIHLLSAFSYFIFILIFAPFHHTSHLISPLKVSEWLRHSSVKQLKP